MTKISQLTALGSALESNDQLFVRDISDASVPVKSVTPENITDTLVKTGDIGTAPNQIPLNQHLGTMAFQSAASINVGQIGADGSLPVLVDRTERLRIDSSGNTLIGTTALATGLSSFAQLQVSSTTGGIIINSATNNIGRLFFTNNNTNANGGEGVIRYDGSNGSMQFFTGAVSTVSQERLRIDSSGRLLVGTSSSRTIAGVNCQSHIEGSSTATSALSIVSNSSTAPEDGTAILLGRSRGSGTTIVQNGDRLGLLYFVGADGTGLNTTAAGIEAWVDGTPGTNDMPGRLVFSTTADGAFSPTERMRITSSGYIKATDNGTYASTTGAYHELNSSANNIVLNITSTSTGSSAYCVSTNLPSGATGRHFTGYLNNTIQFSVAANGNVTNTNNSYGSISDFKLKENITDANSQWSDIKALEIKNFNFIGSTERHIGLIAQQVEQISPGLVDETSDKDDKGEDLGTVTKSVKYSVLYMKAVKALQEAMERIESLEARIAALEA